MTQLATIARRTGVAALATAAATVGFVTSTAPAHATGICDGIKNCKVVAHVDVTGDKVKDTVAVAPQNVKQGYAGKTQVRVLTGKGSLFTYTDKDVSVPAPDVFRGATRLDGKGGAELVLGHTAGAHTVFYKVITFRDHKLVMEKAPKGPGSDGLWFTDGALNSFAGIYRTKDDGKAVVTFKQGARAGVPGGGKFDTDIWSYRWSSGHWAKVSEKHVKRTEKQIAHVWGWHTEQLKGM